jgi:hypothetical protein
MAVEAFILGRNHRTLEDHRHLGERYRPPPVSRKRISTR